MRVCSQETSSWNNRAARNSSKRAMLTKSICSIIIIILNATLTAMIASAAQGQRLKKGHSRQTGVDLHYEVYGTGRPLLMLHGFGGSSFTWRHLIEPFSKTHQLILIDLKGFGRSPKPSDNRYGVQNHADLIYDFILRKDLRNLTLVGHSLGGAVALLTAIKLLDEKKGRLQSLILVDTAAFRQDLPAFIDILRMPDLAH